MKKWAKHLENFAFVIALVLVTIHYCPRHTASSWAHPASCMYPTQRQAIMCDLYDNAPDDVGGDVQKAIAVRWLRTL